MCFYRKTQIINSILKITCFLVFFIFCYTNNCFASLPDFENIQKKLPEVKVEETYINVTPRVKFYLPNGSMDIVLKQKYKNTLITFESSYDFIDNFMGFNVDFLYDIRKSIFDFGINFQDEVTFNPIFSDDNYLQRVKSITPYTQLDLGWYTKFKIGIRFEDTFTDDVSENISIDKGKNNVLEASFQRNTIDEKGTFPKGSDLNLVFKDSLVDLGSDYDYSQAEFHARSFLYPSKQYFLEYAFEAGYPVSEKTRPLTEVYYGGGYKILKGYDYKDFSGNSIIYGSLIYNFPIAKGKSTYFKNIYLLTWNVFGEAGKIGDEKIYSTFNNTKYCAGLGIAYKIILFKEFPVRLEASAAKAFEDRPVKFYFSVSTAYYSFGNI